MASSQSMRLPSMMADTLSCCICLLPYDLEARLPKVFSCQHTVCLSCAAELCQHHLDAEFPCPTCRQPVTIPARGAVGLQTNLDVRNIVEVIQKTKTSSATNPDCPEHPLVPVSHICMPCKVGLCSKCFTSSIMRDHVDHQILEVKEAFEVIKTRCDDLAAKGKEVNVMLQAKSSGISDSTKALLDAANAKSLDVFLKMDEYSAMVTAFTTPNQTEPSVMQAHGSGIKKLSDGKCNAIMLGHSLDCLKRGTSKLENISQSNSSDSIVRTKLATVALQVEVLHLELDGNTDGARLETLGFLWLLTDESEPCCSRFIFLGGVDLLLSYFEKHGLNNEIVRNIMGIYGNLSEHEVLRKSLLTTRAVTMMAYVIQKFTKGQQLTVDESCRTLSLLLSSPSTQWPEDCLSRDETNILLMKTVKLFNPDESIVCGYHSFVPLVALLQQKVSEAAKYWTVWTLNRCTAQESQYCTMLVRDGGIPVLKQQEHADEFVRKLSKKILNRIT